MTVEIILQVILLGVALSMDAFAASITTGLTTTDINKKRIFFMAGTFGVMQGLMPLIGFWIVDLAETIAGEAGGKSVAIIVAKVVVWLAFAFLIFLGLKMIIEAIVEMKKPQEEKESHTFSYKHVLWLGFATAIDALASGIALRGTMSDRVTIWLHISIIIVITFAISLVGVFLGKQITKLLKGKIEIASIIGGSILVLLAIWVIVSHYTGL